METTKLNELLTLLHIPCTDEREILGISDDSRQVKKDWLYVCWRVTGKKKQQYIIEALNKGAVVLCEKEPIKKDVYVCENVENLSQSLIELYYGDLCNDMLIIGVTGTNGKTSVASYMEQVLRMQGKKMMRIGTGEVQVGDLHESIANTTPERFQLAYYFQKAKTMQLDGIVMEVSSHAIDHNRICFVQYDIVILTNITQDHLDYHRTKVHYRFTKYKLRRYLKENGIVIYHKDEIKTKEFEQLYHGVSCSIGMQDADEKIETLLLSDHGSEFMLSNDRIQIPLLGSVNIANVASVIVAGKCLQIPMIELQKSCKNLQAVAGRMEVLHIDDISIWIDFAHTPDALRQLVQFANQVKRGNLITVIGCGGNRDHIKRSNMAKIVAMNSDLAIFTSDNPRNEHGYDILLDMLENLHVSVEIFENRRFAIKHAVTCARKSDIIIIAGKGNETTQEVFGHFYPFSDRDIVTKR